MYRHAIVNAKSVLLRHMGDYVWTRPMVTSHWCTRGHLRIPQQANSDAENKHGACGAQLLVLPHTEDGGGTPAGSVACIPMLVIRPTSRGAIRGYRYRPVPRYWTRFLVTERHRPCVVYVS